jgi:hypothetical protein
VLKKAPQILLRSAKERSIAAFKKLGKGGQIALVGLAGERSKALLYAQIQLIFLQQCEIVCGAHTSIIGVTRDRSTDARNDRTTFITVSKSPTDQGRVNPLVACARRRKAKFFAKRSRAKTGQLEDNKAGDHSALLRKA